ncbi:MAG: hypothetical protein IJX17_01800 [Clostridia bacterium]|nr:hypothetical protein [Clostridia bacterium]
MLLYEYFSYKTLFYFIKGNLEIDYTKFKECEFEDEDGIPTKKYTKEHLESCFDNLFYGDKAITVIKTKYGSFIYHKADDHEYIKSFLKQNSIKKPCGIFGSYRTTNVFTFGIAENGEIQRYFYTDDEDAIDEGAPTEFEKDRPFTYLLDSTEKNCKSINEDYIFDYAKWFTGFDIENEDVEILDMKTYYPCEFSGILSKNIEKEITHNLMKAGTDTIGIFVSYNKAEKQVVIAAENIIDKETRYPIYCDTVSFINNKKEIDLSLRRCLQAISTLDLKTENKTMTSIYDFYNDIHDENASIANITIDIERKFLVAIFSYTKNGKTTKSRFCFPSYNMFYSLPKRILKKIRKRVIKFIK